MSIDPFLRAVVLLCGVLPAQQLLMPGPPPATNLSSNPAGFVAVGPYTLFVATSPICVQGIYRTDGTTAGTELVRDVTVLGRLISLGSSALFIGPGNQLWRTDATPGGTQLLWSFNPIPGSGGIARNWNWGVATAGFVVFAADDGIHGTNPWCSDGTAAGTFPLANIDHSAYPDNFTACGGQVFFTAYEPVHGEELWVTDGTAAGTHLVADLSPGSASTYFHPSGADSPAFAAFGGQLAFAANATTTGDGVFVTDGSSIRTLVTAPTPPATSVYGNLAASSAQLFFTARLGNDMEPWISDGTAAGTHQLADLDPTGPSSPRGAIAFGGGFLFSASDGVHGEELWFTDGTANGTSQLDLRPGPQGSSPAFLTVVGPVALFSADDGVHGRELWVTNGTAAFAADLEPGSQGSYPILEDPVHGKLFFSASQAAIGQEPWVCDLTIAGTHLLRDLETRGGSGNQGFVPAAVLEDHLFFFAPDWRSGPPDRIRVADRTPQGIPTVHDILASFPANGQFSFVVAGGKVWFVQPNALGVTDGSLGGTTVINVPGAVDAQVPSGSGVLLLIAGSSGPSLWRSDGSVAGTVPTGVNFLMPATMAPFGSRALITVQGGFFNNQLLVTDGTPAGTQSLGYVPLMSTPVTAGSLAFFRVLNGLLTNSLWRTDGTAAGTGPLASGFRSADSGPMVAWGNRVLFSANDGIHGSEPWISDGTPAGTRLLADLNPAIHSYPSSFVGLGNHAFFVADDGVHGRELWVTDGTPGGTNMVLDLAPGLADGVSSVYDVGDANRVLFVGGAPDDGEEIWITDGTPAGTRMVADLQPGPGSLHPSRFVRMLDFVFFEATDPLLGRQPWVMPAALAGLAISDPLGTVCALPGREPHMQTLGDPVVGNAAFGWRTTGGPGNALAGLFWATTRGNLSLGACTFVPSVPANAVLTLTNASGSAIVPGPIAASTGLLGLSLFAQWAVLDAGAPVLGIASLSEARFVSIGN